MERLGRLADEDGDRYLYLARLNSLEAWSDLSADPLWREVVEESADGFALFLACDASGLDADVIGAFAAHCIDQGMFWVSAWGPECERVHDIFDEVDIQRSGSEAIVMTTWHTSESLEDALLLFWYAFAAEGKQGGPGRVVLTVGSPNWPDEVRRIAAEDLREAGDSY